MDSFYTNDPPVLVFIPPPQAKTPGPQAYNVLSPKSPHQ